MKKGYYFLLLIYLSFGLSPHLWSQFRVEGARYTEAKAPEGQRMKVLLLNEVSSATTLYFTANSGEQLMTYTESLRDAKPVATAQYNGTAWQLVNPPLGCGYFVQPSQGLPDAYYWLIDYAKQPFPKAPFVAEVDSDSPCERVVLRAEGGFTDLSCYTPQGVLTPIARTYKVQYQDQEYDAANTIFVEKKRVQTLQPQQGVLRLLAPLTDTEFTLLGDAFSEELGYNFEPLHTQKLLGQRVEVHGDLRLVGSTSKADSLPKGSLPRSLSAPAQIEMHAIGNAPVATLFQWRIVRGEAANAENSSVVFQYSGADCSYTFTEAGAYTIELSATSRNGVCSASTDKVTTSVQTSRLEVPNAFSPTSSPGINDLFRVVHTSLVEFDGRIYNEWGNELYHWTDPNGGWDGTYRGQSVSGGVYYYVIYARGADGKVYNERGHINVLDGDLQSTHPNSF